MRLNWQSAILFSLVGIGLTAFLLGDYTRKIRSRAYAQAEHSASLTEKAVAAMVEAEAVQPGALSSRLPERLSRLVKQEGVAAIVVRNIRGRRLIARFDSKSLAKRRPHPDVPLQRVTDGIYDVSAPIKLGRLGRGEILLSLRVGQLQSELDAISSLAIKLGVTISLGVTMLAWILGLFFGMELQRLIPRIEDLARSPEDFRPIKVPESGRDEISRLIRSVNSLGAGLKNEMSRRRDLEEEKQELSSMLVHDLKTPLTVIRSGLGLLAEQWDINHVVPPEKERRARNESPRPRTFELLESSSERLLRMVEDILQLAKLEEIPGLAAAETVDLAAMARACAKDFQLVARRHSQALKSELPSDPQIVRGDPFLLRRVFDNLIHNAVEHTPEGGQITIGVSRSNGEVRTSVSDTGPGIPPEAREAIFRKFYQADVKRYVGNVGLGLALCQKVIERHGGRIGVESAEPRGSIFYFSLPCQEAPVPA